MKNRTFIAHLAEAEKEYKYKLCYAENTDINGMILTFQIYLKQLGVTHVEHIGRPPAIMSQIRDHFNNYKWPRIEIVQIISNRPLNTTIIGKTLSEYAGMAPWRFVLMTDDMKKEATDVVPSDRDESERDATKEIDVDEVVKKIDKGILKDLRDEAAANAKLLKSVYPTPDEPDFKGAVATHREITEMVGHQVRKGYYLIERTGDGVETRIQGPFQHSIDNYDYLNHDVEFELTETNEKNHFVEYRGNMTLVEVDDAAVRPWNVKVVDTDSGEVYEMGVVASNESDARHQAVDDLSRKMNVDKSRLAPRYPEEK